MWREVVNISGSGSNSAASKCAYIESDEAVCTSDYVCYGSSSHTALMLQLSVTQMTVYVCRSSLRRESQSRNMFRTCNACSSIFH